MHTFILMPHKLKTASVELFASPYVTVCRFNISVITQQSNIKSLATFLHLTYPFLTIKKVLLEFKLMIL